MSILLKDSIVCHGGALKWPLKGGSRLIEVAATAGLTLLTESGGTQPKYKWACSCDFGIYRCT